MRKEPSPLAVINVSHTVKSALVKFLQSLGRDIPEINDDTDLIRATRATSDEGVDFAIDLSEVLGVEVPHDFNPFVHRSGRRGMKFHELVESAEGFVSSATEARHGK
jgi:hypothetical protein